MPGGFCQEANITLCHQKTTARKQRADFEQYALLVRTSIADAVVEQPLSANTKKARVGRLILVRILSK